MTSSILAAKILLITCLASASAVVPAADSVSAADLQAMDQILAERNTADKPAVAVVILRGNQPVYERVYGSRDLEHRIPADTNTRFQVDSLAWEVTAFATLLLAQEGKLALDDQIGKFLPELTEPARSVTVDHLLSSTDGFYGYKALGALGGWSAREPALSKMIYDVATRQKGLNFAPGTEFSPGGDTRLVMLARIVERVSGQAFDAFSKSRLFDPLGMTQTGFVYDTGRPVANTAIPYREDGKGGYLRDEGARAAAGPVNLFMSIRDLATWRSKSASMSPVAVAVAARLDAPLKLASGRVIKDLSSISNYRQQHVGKERGITKIYQIGSFGGYASALFRFPAQDTEVLVLSSGLAYNGSFGMRAVSVLLAEDFTEPPVIDYSKLPAVKVDEARLARYTGDYWSPTRALSVKISLENGSLRYGRLNGGRELIPLGDNTFQMKIDSDDVYILRFVPRGDGGGVDLHYTMAGSDPVVFEPYTPARYSAAELAEFTGTFHNAELDTSYVVAVRDGVLTASNLRVGTIDFKPLRADLFNGNQTFMAGVEFLRGSGKAVTGFQVVIDEIRHLRFDKMPSAPASGKPSA